MRARWPGAALALVLADCCDNGRIISAGIQGFTGAIDEVAIYLTALPQGIIREHAKRGSAR